MFFTVQHLIVILKKRKNSQDIRKQKESPQVDEGFYVKPTTNSGEILRLFTFRSETMQECVLSLLQ